MFTSATNHQVCLAKWKFDLVNTGAGGNPLRAKPKLEFQYARDGVFTITVFFFLIRLLVFLFAKRKITEGFMLHMFSFI